VGNGARARIIHPWYEAGLLEPGLMRRRPPRCSALARRPGVGPANPGPFPTMAADHAHARARCRMGQDRGVADFTQGTQTGRVSSAGVPSSSQSACTFIRSWVYACPGGVWLRATSGRQTPNAGTLTYYPAPRRARRLTATQAGGGAGGGSPGSRVPEPPLSSPATRACGGSKGGATLWWCLRHVRACRQKHSTAEGLLVKEPHRPC
jgi:hypothetical protein